jgi:hypothetical protein
MVLLRTFARAAMRPELCISERLSTLGETSANAAGCRVAKKEDWKFFKFLAHPRFFWFLSQLDE